MCDAASNEITSGDACEEEEELVEIADYNIESQILTLVLVVIGIITFCVIVSAIRRKCRARSRASEERQNELIRQLTQTSENKTTEAKTMTTQTIATEDK